jgi:hypothetical protein
MGPLTNWSAFVPTVKGWHPQRGHAYSCVLLRHLRYFGISTASVKRGACWEVRGLSGLQNICCVSCNQKVHGRVHKSLPLLPALSQINLVYSLPFHALGPISLHCLSNNVCLSVLSSYNLHTSLFSPCVLHVLPISSCLAWVLWRRNWHKAVRQETSGMPRAALARQVHKDECHVQLLHDRFTSMNAKMC